MKYKESNTIELKREITPDLKKEIVAFANSNGGTIYIGVSDDGTIEGLNAAEEDSLKVMNMIRDSIKPGIPMFTSINTETIKDNNIIRIDIQKGTQKPYYLSEKGLKTSGVYVRQGAASVPASENAIKQMLKSTDGDTFEDARSLIQDLTFTTALGNLESTLLI